MGIKPDLSNSKLHSSTPLTWRLSILTGHLRMTFHTTFLTVLYPWWGKAVFLTGLLCFHTLLRLSQSLAHGKLSSDRPMKEIPLIGYTLWDTCDIPGFVLRCLWSFCHPFYRMILQDGAIIAFLTSENSDYVSSGIPADMKLIWDLNRPGT